MIERDEPTATVEPLAPVPAAGAVATLDAEPPDAVPEEAGADLDDADRDVEAATDAEPAPPLADLATLLEALLFVSDGPVSERTLARALEVTPRHIRAALDALGDALRERGLRVQRGPEGAQLVTAPQAAAAVEALLGLEGGRRLSPAAMETLAIVAYRQPVTRGQVERIRGVSSDAGIATLRARELIVEVGRAPGPGRPTLFGTTQRFLGQFGLEHPQQLPPLPPDLAPLPEDAASQLALPDEGADDRAADALDVPPVADSPSPPADDVGPPPAEADAPPPDALPERWSPPGFDAATPPLG
jgi:segregation and condensation protein B